MIMKRIIIYIYSGVMFTLIIGLSGCYKDIITPELGSGPDDFPPKQVSFQTELAPIFNTSCAVAGCHVSGAHTPYLATAVSFTEIINGGYVNLTDPKRSKIDLMITGEMAQYMPAPVKTNTQKVYDWIRNGAPKN
jgi:hypothetical protein